MRARGSRIDPYLASVGQQPDRAIAKLANVTIQAVRDYRKRKGIPAHTRQVPINLPKSKWSHHHQDPREGAVIPLMATRLLSPQERAMLPQWMPDDLAEAVMDLTSRLTASGITTITLTPTTVEGKRATVENWKVNL